MQTSQKVMTAFRVETGIYERIRERARGLGISVNRYITTLIVKDLNECATLPKAHISDESISFAGRFAGILNEPGAEELQNDERLKAIWER